MHLTQIIELLSHYIAENAYLALDNALNGSVRRQEEEAGWIVFCC